MTVLHRLAPAAPTPSRPVAAARHALRANAAALVRALRKAGTDAALAAPDEAGAGGPKARPPRPSPLHGPAPRVPGHPVHLHAGLPAEALAGRLGRGGTHAAVLQLWDALPADTKLGWAAKLAFHGVPEVLVPCVCQKERLAAAGLDGGRCTVHVVPAGTDLKEHSPPTVHEREEARARFGLPPPGAGAVALVRDAPGAAAGLDALLDAMVRLPGLQLVVPVAPDGRDEAGGRLRERVAARGLASRVRFVAAAQPAVLHATADVAVLPWRTGDALPCHPQEALAAMAAGLPVVASATGCLPELVPHGAAGLLVEPADPLDLVEALGRLASDEALLRRLGAGARAAAEARHDGDAVARQVAALYARVAPEAAAMHTDVPVRFAA